MMYKCESCSRPTTGVLIRNPETNSLAYLPTLCSRCLMEMSKDIGENLDEDLDKKGFTCKKCNAKVWSLRNFECIDCYSEACELVEKLPDIDPIDPPLGYHLIGETEASARAEIEFAYKNTPSAKDLEN